MKGTITNLTWKSVKNPPQKGTRVLVLLSFGSIVSGVADSSWSGGFKSGKSSNDGGHSLGGFVTGEPILWTEYPKQFNKLK